MLQNKEDYIGEKNIRTKENLKHFQAPILRKSSISLRELSEGPGQVDRLQMNRLKDREITVFLRCQEKHKYTISRRSSEVKQRPAWLLCFMVTLSLRNFLGFYGVKDN